MATWAVQRAGNFATASSNPASPWHDGGSQTALASIPAVGDTITNAGAFSLTFNIDLPSVASVLDSDTVYGAAGTYHAPDAAEVIDTATFGPGSAIAGTFDEAARNTNPGTANVRFGVNYKIQNVDYVGSVLIDSGVDPDSQVLIETQLAIGKRRYGAKQ